MPNSSQIFPLWKKKREKSSSFSTLLKNKLPVLFLSSALLSIPQALMYLKNKKKEKTPHLLCPPYCYGNVLHKIKTKQFSKEQLLTHQNWSFLFSPPPTREILATCPGEEEAMANWGILHHAFQWPKLAFHRLHRGTNLKGEGTFYKDCVLPLVPLWGPTANVYCINRWWYLWQVKLWALYAMVWLQGYCCLGHFLMLITRCLKLKKKKIHNLIIQ